MNIETKEITLSDGSKCYYADVVSSYPWELKELNVKKQLNDMYGPIMEKKERPE